MRSIGVFMFPLSQRDEHKLINWYFQDKYNPLKQIKVLCSDGETSQPLILCLSSSLMKQTWRKLMVPREKIEQVLSVGRREAKVCPLISIISYSVC